ncbi:MAG: alanine--tRNA ligase [Bacillota bacterium]
MKQLDSKTLKKMYLEFFQSHGHAVIQSSSLIPENDPTVLFTTAGMHPLVPYLLGEKHPAGTRLVDVQKCVRTGDIEDVGDDTHLTFFEMLGNWSLGDYFKEEAIAMSYEFLTSEKYLNLPIEKLAVTVFQGDADAPRDEESADIWASHGMPREKIFYLEKKHNWWGPAGTTGPCGPDSEMFIDTGKEKCCEECSPACSCGKYIEIWNDVFMQYFKDADGNFTPLSQQNVDTGMGVERVCCTYNGVNTVYETDVFADATKYLEEVSGKKIADEEYKKAFRIVLDHTRTATFILGDFRGVTPSNVDQGYVLRRLIRRAIRFGRLLELPKGTLAEVAKLYIAQYSDFYQDIADNAEKIVTELNLEEEKFSKTIEQGLKEFEKVAKFIKGDIIPGKTAFRLYDTFGFPLEITQELAVERGFTVDEAGYHESFKKHQLLSQQGSEQRFKGGLADSSVQTSNLHTATHLLNAALRKVLEDDKIQQKGSNITAERLRFDFNFPRPVTKDELAKIEEFVNNAISAKAEITMQEMTVEQAEAKGAIGVFASKYGEIVKVYKMGDFSCEICGGPHASNTGDLGKFKIQKEQSSSSGVRRIKAVLITE